MGGIIGAVAAPLVGSVAGDIFGGGSSSGSSGAGQVASGAANIVGGALSTADAQNFANQVGQTANPFGQYNQQFGSSLASQAGAGIYGQAVSGNQNMVNQFAQNTASGMGSTLAGVNNATTAGQSGLNSLNLQGINSQYQSLLQNPDSIYQSQAYQSALGQGTATVNNQLAAQGLNASGNQLAALQNYGQSFASNYASNYLGQLATGSQLAASQQQQGYNQELGTAQANLAGNQQAYTQLSNANTSGLATQEQGFNQLSLLSGASNGSPTAAAAAQSNILGQVNSSAQSIGTGIGQVASGLGNVFGNTGTTQYPGQFGASTSTSGSIDGGGSLFGTSAGIDDTSYNYSGGNSYGFT